MLFKKQSDEIRVDKGVCVAALVLTVDDRSNEGCLVKGKQKSVISQVSILLIRPKAESGIIEMHDGLVERMALCAIHYFERLTICAMLNETDRVRMRKCLVLYRRISVYF